MKYLSFILAFGQWFKNQKKLPLCIAVFCIILLVIISSCNDAKLQPKPSKHKQLFVLVYDISVSVDHYAILEPTHFSQLYYSLGTNGGGKFYGLLIKANSNKQEPFNLLVKPVDTLAMQGNNFQIERRKSINTERMANFEQGKQSFVENGCAALIKPKTEKFSDVENAMLLAKQIVDMPAYADWDKCILIVSDCINDEPPVDGPDKMNPIKFSSDITIGVVRPSATINLSTIFLGTQVTPYSTIQDGIQSLLTAKY